VLQQWLLAAGLVVQVLVIVVAETTEVAVEAV
jgi:hypothetical protein